MRGRSICPGESRSRSARARSVPILDDATVDAASSASASAISAYRKAVSGSPMARRDDRIASRLTSAVPNDHGFEVRLAATRCEPASGSAPPRARGDQHRPHELRRYECGLVSGASGDESAPCVGSPGKGELTHLPHAPARDPETAHLRARFILSRQTKRTLRYGSMLRILPPSTSPERDAGVAGFRSAVTGPSRCCRGLLLHHRLGDHLSRSRLIDTPVRTAKAKLTILAPVHHGGRGTATRNAHPIKHAPLGTDDCRGVDDAVEQHRSAQARSN